MFSRIYGAASIVFALFVLACTDATATTQRAFVASYGNDTNPCSLTLPCRTFAAAIATTPPNGEVIVLDSGGYGAVTITQSVSIIAAPGVYAGISVFASDIGVTVAAGATDKVVLRGLTINGQGGHNGIYIYSAGHVYIERCTIADMRSAGVRVGDSSVFILDSLVNNNLEFGVYIGASSGKVWVNDSRFIENTTGLLVYTGTLIANRIVVENNSAGGVVAAGIFEGAFVTLTDSVLSGNGGVGASLGRGIGADTGPVEMRVIRSTVSNNGFEGFQINGQEGFRSFVLSDSAVVRNGQGNSGAGVALVGGAEVRATITGSTIEANAGVGIAAVGSTTVVSGSTVSNNGAAGLIAGNAGTVIVSGSTLAANALADLSQTGAAVLRSSGTNTLTGRGAADISGTITPDPLK